MITITNPKVHNLEPSWAPFKGFSLLFDNPGDSLRPYQPCADTEVMSTRYDDPQSEYYRILWEQIAVNGSELRASSAFCPLPLHSYHVTVWDGLNDYNAKKFAEGDRLDAYRFLRGLPGTMLTNSPFLTDAGGEPIQIRIRPIEFVYAGLEKWNDSSLVSLLRPANLESADVLASIESERLGLNAYFTAKFGVTTAVSSYRPHVSLGYFANKALGGTADQPVIELDHILRTKMAGRIVRFETISMYGMVDMETFFRRTPSVERRD